MAASRPARAWAPRGMREEDAAYYVGVSPSTFRAQVKPEVPPVPLTQGRQVWLREDLDAYLDRKAGRDATLRENPWLTPDDARAAPLRSAIP